MRKQCSQREEDLDCKSLLKQFQLCSGQIIGTNFYGVMYQKTPFLNLERRFLKGSMTLGKILTLHHIAKLF